MEFLLENILNLVGFIIGIIIGAIFLDIWGAETSLLKALLALGWTALFLIALFYSEKENN